MGRLAWYSNAGGEPREVEAGVHAVSNALLDTPWPKVVRSAAALARILGREDEIDPEELFALLADREPASDGELPDTGVGLATERILSSPFIAAPGYGTRGSTILLVTSTGRATFLERRFDEAFCGGGTSRFELDFRGWGPPERAPDPSPENGLQDPWVRSVRGLMCLHHFGSWRFHPLARGPEFAYHRRWIFRSDAHHFTPKSLRHGLKEEIPCHFCSAD